MAGTELNRIARAMVAKGKGILAADESTGTIAKRLKSINVENSEEHRRGYREMLFTTEGAEQFISGVILYDETLRQSTASGTRFADLLTGKGVIPGIKVDTGPKDLCGAPGEKVTEGLDGLRERFAEYHKLGARFSKWRAVITIGDGIPSDYCLEANAHALARYAALSQEAGIVPIVEPEVLMDGKHTHQRCFEVTERAHRFVFNALYLQRVALDGMILKPNMIVSGTECAKQASIDEVADATVACFKRSVPAEVPGIVFLSGGQSEEEATAHLSAMNARHKNLPWELSFSYGRALQASALKAWGGQEANLPAGQKTYFHRARLNGLARSGEYKAELETVTA